MYDVLIGYDTTEEFNIDSKGECDQLNLTHVTKTNKRQSALSYVQVQHCVKRFQKEPERL